MDWKHYYADELAQPWGREAVRAAVDGHANGSADDARLSAALQAGAVVSFPHVTLRDSAEPLARVAHAVLGSGRRRVVALGVLHASTLPQALRQAWSTLQGDAAQARAIFPRFAGAFYTRGAVHTPYGTLDDGPAPAPGAWVREDAEMLAGEFSLDLFTAVLAAAAQSRGVRPPAVTRLFACTTRSPDGELHVARALADELRAMVAPGDAVCVTTGDVAHVGHGYTPLEELAALPADRAALEHQVLAGIHEQHHQALVQRDFDAAWAIGTRWRSDQRHLLPVIAELLGQPARYELLSFGMSDYSQINGMPPPCLVAAALGLFSTAA